MTFAQIIQLGYKIAQSGLTRTIINILANLDRVQVEFSRRLSHYMIIAVMLERNLEYKKKIIYVEMCDQNLSWPLLNTCVKLQSTKIKELSLTMIVMKYSIKILQTN